MSDKAHVTLFNGAAEVASGDVTAYVQVRTRGMMFTICVSRFGLRITRNDPKYGDVEDETSLSIDELPALVRHGLPLYSPEMVRAAAEKSD